MTLEKIITNPNKVFWPDEGYTKLDLARFYEAVFPKLKPYVANRMLTMERCPDGMRGECFYQKEAPKGLPPGSPTQLIKHSNRNVRYVVGGSLETQLALVNLGCIPVHVWASRAGHERQPDWMVFDLDPSSKEFADVARAGLLVKEALDELELVSFPKTSGSRGLHVFVPLRVGLDFDEVLRFAREICERLPPTPASLPWSSASRIAATAYTWNRFATASAQLWWLPIPCGAARVLLSRCRCAGAK